MVMAKPDADAPLLAPDELESLAQLLQNYDASGRPFSNMMPSEELDVRHGRWRRVSIALRTSNTTSALTSAPAHASPQELMSSVRRLKGQPIDEPPVEDVTPEPGCARHTRCGVAVLCLCRSCRADHPVVRSSCAAGLSSRPQIKTAGRSSSTCATVARRAAASCAQGPAATLPQPQHQHQVSAAARRAGAAHPLTK